MVTNSSLASGLFNYSSFNSSAITEPHEHVIWLTTLTQIVCIIIIICGTIGNTTVLVVFIAKWNSISTYEIFMINLAVADLIGTMVYPNILLHEVSGGSFHLIGGVGCKILYFLSSSGLYISSSTLVMVSIDRYLVIKYPFKHQNTRCRYMIITTWLFSFGCAAIYLTGDRVKLYGTSEYSVCRLFPKTLNEIITITLTTFSLQNVMPIFVMTIMYVLVVFQLRNHGVGNDFTLSRSGITRLRQRAAKTMKLLVVIVAVFSFCATPINIFYILYLFQTLKLSEDFIHLIMVMLTMLMMTNSCVNPIIYGKLHMTFRRQAITLLHSLFIKPYRYTRRTIRTVTMRNFKSRFRTNLHKEQIPLKTPIIAIQCASKKSVHYFDSKMIWNGNDNECSSLLDLNQENRKISDISTDTTDTQIFPMNVINIKMMLQMVRETNEEELVVESKDGSNRPSSFLSDLCWMVRIGDVEQETEL